MCEQHSCHSDVALKAYAVAHVVVLLELHLQQVVLQRHAGVDRVAHITINAREHGVGHVQRVEFLVESHELPEILFGCKFHVVFRLFELQLAHVNAQSGKLVAVDNLSAGKQGV